MPLKYEVLTRNRAFYLTDLIAQLQSIQDAYGSQGNVYVLDSKGEYLTLVETVESTLSDGSKAVDVRLRPAMELERPKAA